MAQIMAVAIPVRIKPSRMVLVLNMPVWCVVSMTVFDYDIKNASLMGSGQGK